MRNYCFSFFHSFYSNTKGQQGERGSIGLTGAVGAKGEVGEQGNDGLPVSCYVKNQKKKKMHMKWCILISSSLFNEI